MSTTATITWSFVPGSLSTLVEYRVSGTTTWIQPTIPQNPTTQNTYPIIISDNIYYDVRLTTNGIRCGSKSTTFQIISSAGCCPPGYTLFPDGTYCFQESTTTATPPTSSENSVARSAIDYTICGTWIYTTFNLDGTGASTQISTSNPFWVNGVGDCLTGGTTVDGPMNRCALWATSQLSGQQIGFSVCVDIPESKTYYIGVGADNFATIKIDGTTIVDQNRFAMDAQYGTPGGSGPLRVWAIYPISVLSGTHVLELIGTNGPEPIPNPAALGAEIYDNTPSEIAAATSYGDLNLIFSTKDYVGQPIQFGSDGIGYTCPDGFALVLCDGPPFCRKVLTNPTIPCSTTTSTTTTTTTTP